MSTGRRFDIIIGSNVRCSANDGGTPISCSSDTKMSSHIYSNIPLQDAHVLYCVAAAAGHNKV